MFERRLLYSLTATLFLSALLPGSVFPPSALASPTASITIDPLSSSGVFNREILGIHIPYYVAEPVVYNPAFFSRLRDLAPTRVRWPDGNNSCTYNWKIDGLFRDTLSTEYGIGIDEVAGLCDSLNTKLQIAVNFGTMNAADAGDLVEYCNSTDITRGWGSTRASRGHPQPYNVQDWEIGNELDGPHMWAYSWSAEDPLKYYFGGSEERRGIYTTLYESAPKGDLFVSDGLPSQRFLIRFPDVVPQSDSVSIGTSGETMQPWSRVDDLDLEGSGRYYEMDYSQSVLRFGDGTHGDIPPAGWQILCEYTTANHDGALAFIDSMRSRDPSLRIGGCMFPEGWGGDTLTDILSRADFITRHHYTSEYHTSTSPSFAERMTYASTALGGLYEWRGMIENSAGVYADSIGLGFTEWNYILEAPVEDASLASALFTAEMLGSLASASGTLKLSMANRYGLVQEDGWDSYFCLLTPPPAYVPRPAFYAFKMFSRHFGQILVSNQVSSPFFEVEGYMYPCLVAYSSVSPARDTLYLVVVNRDSVQSLATQIDVSGITSPGSSATVRTLNGSELYSTNEQDSTAVVLRDSTVAWAGSEISYTFPAHSVTQMEFSLSTTGIAGPGSGRGSAAVPRSLRCFPTPFCGHAEIEFSLPNGGRTQVGVYNIAGQKVKTLLWGNLEKGWHHLSWDGRNDAGLGLPSGVYFVQLLVGGDTLLRRKMVLLR